MKSLTVWRGHSTRPSLPVGTARRASGSLPRGRRNRLIMQTTKNRKFPLGRFCPAGRKARGTDCSNPPFCCPIKSAKNKKSSTPQGAALGATGRIRTSGLPGRRTTTGWYRLTMKREFCWLCTFAVKTRKSPLLVVTTGFSSIAQGYCTVVVKWWSGMEGHKSRNIEYDPRHLTQRMILYTILINNKYGGA